MDKLRSNGTAAHFACPSVHLFAHHTSSSHLNKTKVNHHPWDTLFYKLRQNVWETSDFEFCLSVVYLPFCLPLHLLLLCYILLLFPCQHSEYIVCFTCVSLALWCVLSHGPQPPHPVIIVFLLKQQSRISLCANDLQLTHTFLTKSFELCPVILVPAP